MREKIEQLEALMKRTPGSLSKDDFQVFNHFSPGVYIREVRIPSGVLVTGKIHRTEHLNVLSQGRIVVWTESGVREFEAPAVIPSMPGAKRVGLALSDVTWLCVHSNPDDSQDLAVLESRLTADSFEELEAFERKEIL